MSGVGAGTCQQECLCVLCCAFPGGESKSEQGPYLTADEPEGGEQEHQRSRTQTARALISTDRQQVPPAPFVSEAFCTTYLGYLLAGRTAKLLESDQRKRRASRHVVGDPQRIGAW